MKKLKRTGWIFLGLVLFVFLGKGILFRLFVSYQPLGHRKAYTISHTDLLKQIRAYSEKNNKQTAEEAVSDVLTLTAERLSFSSSARETNPDVLVRTHQAHCVGTPLSRQLF